MKYCRTADYATVLILHIYLFVNHYECQKNVYDAIDICKSLE